jgi:hypothetical protein
VGEEGRERKKGREGKGEREREGREGGTEREHTGLGVRGLGFLGPFRLPVYGHFRLFSSCLSLNSNFIICKMKLDQKDTRSPL